jgi:hypothetical protein
MFHFKIPQVLARNLTGLVGEKGPQNPQVAPVLKPIHQRRQTCQVLGRAGRNAN